MIRRLASAAAIVALLSACAATAPRPTEPEPRATPAAPAKPPRTTAPSSGGLYAPHIRDGGPPVVPDISGIPEPIPVVEPRARYGNHSPYTVLGRTYRVLDDPGAYLERGTASWYGTKFHGRPTSSFEPYDMYKFTAAHRSLPLPSYVRVTNLDNGKSVVVRVNDRGPFHGDRLIDLSYVAAVKLDMHHRGTAPVEVRLLVPEDRPASQLAAAAAVTPSGNAAPADGRVFLQVASFAQRDNADRLGRQLRDAGLKDVDLQRAEVDGKAVWRVRLGPFARTAGLERARVRVRALGLGEPQTVAH